MFDYSELFLQNIVKGDDAYQNDILSKQHIVDLGVIQSYSPDGTANVLMLYFNQGQPVVFKGVEVLFIGTNTGAVTYNPEGSLCLLFKPTTCIPNTQDMKIDFAATASSNAGMKAIPITNGVNCSLNTGFDGPGNFFIKGEQVGVNITPTSVNMSFKGNTISLTSDGLFSTCMCNGKLFINHKDDGTSQYLRFDNDNKASQYVSIQADGSFTVKEGATASFSDSDYDDLDSFTKWLWVKTYNRDGSRSFVLGDGDGNAKLSLSIDTDGQVSLVKGNVNVDITESDNKQTISITGNNTSITIDGDGVIAINAGSNDVNVTCGTFNVNNGDLEVT